MRITQGTFSYLPDLSDAQIRAQIQYCIDQDWAVSIEFTDDPHPRNAFWDMWGMPMFDLKDAAGIMSEVQACRNAKPNTYIKVNGYDRRYTRQTVAISFLVQRPSNEPGFRLDRTEMNDRHIAYTMHSYAAEKPHGDRYEDNGKG